MTENTYELQNHTEKVVKTTMVEIPRIRFWVSPGAKSPTISTAGSGGLDLYVDTVISKEDRLEIGTSLFMQIPLGHVGLLLPRSSVGVKGMRLKNTVGVIDSDYRGEIKIICDRFEAEEAVIQPGNRIAQLVIIPVCPFPVEQVGSVEDLTWTSRGTGGFGSTGE